MVLTKIRKLKFSILNFKWFSQQRTVCNILMQELKTHGDCKGASLVLIMLLSKCFLYSTIPGFLQKMLLNFFFY